MSLIAPSGICKVGVSLGGDLFGIHVNKNYNNEYLSYLINYIYKSKLARYAQGSTIIHLHYSDIKNVMLLLPAIEEQNYLAHLMKGMEEKIEIEKDMLSKFYRQKAYLLSKLFI
jgi:type I restriction enzyme S subunit